MADGTVDLSTLTGTELTVGVALGTISADEAVAALAGDADKAVEAMFSALVLASALEDELGTL